MARAQEIGIQLHVAHYNHRWRSEASDADASFVKSLANSFNLPFLSDTRSEKEAAFTETTARMLRLDFLRKAAHLQHCDYIVFGHQLDDIIETQLQRIARGCASNGLAAPRPVLFLINNPHTCVHFCISGQGISVGHSKPAKFHGGKTAPTRTLVLRVMLYAGMSFLNFATLSVEIQPSVRLVVAVY